MMQVGEGKSVQKGMEEVPSGTLSNTVDFYRSWCCQK